MNYTKFKDRNLRTVRGSSVEVRDVQTPSSLMEDMTKHPAEAITTSDHASNDEINMIDLSPFGFEFGSDNEPDNPQIYGTYSKDSVLSYSRSVSRMMDRDNTEPAPNTAFSLRNNQSHRSENSSEDERFVSKPSTRPSTARGRNGMTPVPPHTKSAKSAHSSRTRNIVSAAKNRLSSNNQGSNSSLARSSVSRLSSASSRNASRTLASNDSVNQPEMFSPKIEEQAAMESLKQSHSRSTTIKSFYKKKDLEQKWVDGFLNQTLEAGISVPNSGNLTAISYNLQMNNF